MEKYYNPFKVKMVKDGDEYTLGMYVDRVPVFGLYVDGEEDFIKELEIKAKAKFKLENDAENYAQEVRMYYYIVLGKYLNKFGEPETEKQKQDMVKYVCKGCLNKLRDLSRSMKNKLCYYDKEKEEVVFHTLMSLNSMIDYTKNKNIIDKLDYIIHSNEPEENYSIFAKWFELHKNEILTKKQLDYLDDNNTVSSNKNKKAIEQNIIRRVDRKYSNLSVKDCKLMDLTNKKNILEHILNSESHTEFLENIVNSLDEDWLSDMLYSMDVDVCKMITSATKGIYEENKCIYKICKKIIEKDIELEELIEKVKMDM